MEKRSFLLVGSEAHGQQDGPETGRLPLLVDFALRERGRITEIDELLPMSHELHAHESNVETAELPPADFETKFLLVVVVAVMVYKLHQVCRPGVLDC